MYALVFLELERSGALNRGTWASQRYNPRGKVQGDCQVRGVSASFFLNCRVGADVSRDAVPDAGSMKREGLQCCLQSGDIGLV